MHEKAGSRAQEAIPRLLRELEGRSQEGERWPAFGDCLALKQQGEKDRGPEILALPVPGPHPRPSHKGTGLCCSPGGIVPPRKSQTPSLQGWHVRVTGALCLPCRGWGLHPAQSGHRKMATYGSFWEFLSLREGSSLQVAGSEQCAEAGSEWDAPVTVPPLR